MDKLLPCPFCGKKEAQLHQWYFGAVILCGKCKAQGPPVYEPLGDIEAGTLWNKRRLKHEAIIKQTVNQRRLFASLLASCGCHCQSILMYK